MNQLLPVVAAAMVVDLVGAVEDAHRESPIIIANKPPKQLQITTYNQSN